MPLALLLQKAVSSYQATAKKVSGWIELVELEEVLLARARSAFLVHWFGHRLPFDGLSLKVVITNLGDLNQRFLQVQRSLRTSQRGPNLTEPLMQWLGTFGGVLMSPLGAITGSILLLKVADTTAKVVLGALAWMLLPAVGLPAMLAAMPRLGLLLGIGLVGGGLWAGMAAGLSNRREIRALFDLGGHLARMFIAGTDLLNQLLGPRSEVRNPLLRRFLEVADRLAAMFAQLLGFAAVFVTRIAPALAPAARAIMALVALGQAVGAALAEIVSGARTRLDELLTGQLSPVNLVRRLLRVARRGLTALGDAATVTLAELRKIIDQTQTLITGTLADAASEIGAWLKWRIEQIPLVQVILALVGQVTAIKAAFAAVPPPPPDPSAEPGMFAPLIAAIPAPPPTPDLPALPTLPAPADIWRSLGRPGAPDVGGAAIAREVARLAVTSTAPTVEFGPDAQSALARLRGTPAVFAPERLALEQRFGAPPAEALAANRAELERYLQALNVVVGRILPPEMRAQYMPQLVNLLTSLDQQVYGARPTAPPAGGGGTEPSELPVLDIPDSGRLQPVVSTLRLRMPGAHVNDVKRFEGLLLERLRSQAYRAPVAAGSP